MTAGLDGLTERPCPPSQVRFELRDPPRRRPLPPYGTFEIPGWSAAAAVGAPRSELTATVGRVLADFDVLDLGGERSADRGDHRPAVSSGGRVHEGQPPGFVSLGGWRIARVACLSTQYAYMLELQAESPSWALSGLHCPWIHVTRGLGVVRRRPVALGLSPEAFSR